MLAVKRRLERAGITSAKLDARLIVQHATGMSLAQFIAEDDRQISDGEMTLIEELVRRRARCEPVSRLIGEREFYGRNFLISPYTLDPRPDTETLVDAALRIIRSNDSGGVLRIADIGTGSGAIIITLLMEAPDCLGLGSDISEEALAVARANALRHGVGDRVDLVESFWFERISGSFDLIVSNPPYVSDGDIPALPKDVFLYEPREALDGGRDGLHSYREIARTIRSYLRIGGHACLEIGWGQEAEITDIMLSCGLKIPLAAPARAADLAGITRVLMFQNR
jgi:release factor glutamine methyltransferase